LAQRNAGIRTFTYDDIPLTLLHRRLEVQREHYERAAHIFVFSQWLRQKMLRLDGLSPDKVHVVGAGSNLGRRWAQNPYGDRNLKTPRVLFVGRDWIRKGGPLLLQAWRTVRRAIPNAELVAVGPGAAVSDPRLGITGRAPLTDDEICGLLQESSLFVMPTLWEAFGVVFTEAMSAGVPVVGPRRMAVPEIIKHGETGYLVDQDEPELYAEQIIAALRDPVRLCELSEAAFARSRLFTWSRVFSRMDAVMRPIVAATDDRSADFGTS
ncbi:MAG: glycosyltransferase family 4 protein, partial [Clostridia bacterium]